MVLQWLVGGGLVLAGNAMSLGSVMVGYRLATSHQKQLEYERDTYGTARPPGM